MSLYRNSEYELAVLPPADYNRLDLIAWGARQGKILALATRLGIFDHLETPKTAIQLADEMAFDKRQTEKFCDYLVALGFLTKKAEAYHLTKESETFLLKTSPYFAGNLITHSYFESDINPEAVTSILKNGLAESPSAAHMWRYTEWGWLALAEAPTLGGVQNTLKIINQAIKMDNIKEVLDLGCGPGMYAVALQKKYPHIHVTACDLPEIVEKATIPMLKSQNLENIKTLPADMQQDEIGKGYDLVFASNSMYMDKLTVQAVLKKIQSSLNPNGYIVVKLVLKDGATAWSMSLDFTMSMGSKADLVYSVEEFKEMLTSAGFRVICVEDSNDPAYHDKILISQKS